MGDSNVFGLVRKAVQWHVCIFQHNIAWRPESLQLKLLQVVHRLKVVFGADAAETQPSRKKSKKQKKKQKQQQAQMAAAGQDSEEEQASTQAIHTHHNRHDDEAEDDTAHSSQDGEEDVLERMMEAANISQSAVSRGAHQVDHILLVDSDMEYSLLGVMLSSLCLLSSLQ